MSQGWIQEESLYPYGSSVALSPGASTTDDIIIVKTFPGIQFQGTESNAVQQEEREVSGDYWFATNATYEPSTGTPNQWTQFNASIPSYAWVLRANGSVQRLQAPAGAAAPISWTTLSTIDALGRTTLSTPQLTAAQPLFEITSTWNAPGVVMNAITVDVTDTASNAASTLEDLQVNGVSKWTVSKSGALVAGSVPYSLVSGGPTNIVLLNPPAQQSGNINIGGSLTANFGTITSISSAALFIPSGNAGYNFTNYGNTASLLGIDNSGNVNASGFLTSASDVQFFGGLAGNGGSWTTNGTAVALYVASSQNGGGYVSNAGNTASVFSWTNSGTLSANELATTTLNFEGSTGGLGTIRNQSGQIQFFSYDAGNAGFYFYNYNATAWAPLSTGALAVTGNAVISGGLTSNTVTAAGITSTGNLSASNGSYAGFFQLSGAAASTIFQSAGRLFFTAYDGTNTGFSFVNDVNSAYSPVATGTLSVNGQATASQFNGSGAGLSAGTIPNASLVSTPTLTQDTGGTVRAGVCCFGQSTTSTGGTILVTLPRVYTSYSVTGNFGGGTTQGYVVDIVIANGSQFTVSVVQPGVGGVVGAAVNWIVVGY
jgi:hypothetical protein